MSNETYKLWYRGPVLKELRDFEPLLAQWEKSTHPAQIRLNDYLCRLKDHFLPLSSDSKELFLHMEVDIQEPERLLDQKDLENYLTPLFGSKCFDSSRFILVSAIKRVGGGSSLQIGRAEKYTLPFDNSDSSWGKAFCNPGSGTSSKKWKEQLHAELLTSCNAVLPEGPVEVHLAFRCSQRRNWANLWKPTGDAMGPVLGYASSNNIFHPKDDRITSISFHKTLDNMIGYGVEIGMWWREA